MDSDMISIIGLLTFLFGFMALVITVRGLKLPKSFYEKERKRAAMRAKLLELELVGKEETVRLNTEAVGGKASGEAARRGAK